MRPYTAVHTYQCTCQSMTKLYLRKSVHKRWETLSTVFTVKIVDQVISHLTFNDTQMLSVSVSVTFHLDVVRCYWSIYCMFLYICIIKKVQPINPQIQHHLPWSREVFRHWWVTIIKTPKVREMTKATLFDSFYIIIIIIIIIMKLNELCCADRPCCPSLN